MFEAMSQQQSSLRLQRIDVTKNMARYYALSIQPTLFGQTSLVRAWGRIGTQGKEIVHMFEREQDAVALLRKIAEKKQKKGYSVK